MASLSPVLSNNGWIRNTRVPAVVAPPGSCDCQVHVYGPPGSCSLDPSRTYEPPEASFDEARRMHRTLGITRGVLVQPTVYGTDHTVLLAALEQGEGRYLATGIVNDTVSDAALERLANAGVRGARFNFLNRQYWTREKFERTAARIADLGWIAVVHGSADELLEREDMLCRVSSPVLIDHMLHWDLSRSCATGPHIEFALRLLGRGNFWIKLANGDRISRGQSPYDDTIGLAQTFIKAVPERTVWATDWPHVLYRKPVVPNDAELLELLFRYAPEAGVRQKILVDNPAALFGFGPDTGQTKEK